jgi:S1-C subfamily serine protease
LGVQISDVTAKLAEEKDLKLQKGVYVGGVGKGSAGEDAGIAEGDVITAVDGKNVNSSGELQETIARRRPGDKVVVTLNRKGSVKTVTATLKNRTGSTNVVKRPDPVEGPQGLGLELKEVDEKTLKAADAPYGVKVEKVLPGIVQEQTDMRPGFIITKVDKKPIKTLKDAKEALKNAKEGVLVEGVYPDYPGTQYYAFGESK